MDELACCTDASEPRPTSPMPRLGLWGQHTVVACEPRADGTDKEDRRSEPVIA